MRSSSGRKGKYHPWRERLSANIEGTFAEGLRVGDCAMAGSLDSLCHLVSLCLYFGSRSETATNKLIFGSKISGKCRDRIDWRRRVADSRLLTPSLGSVQLPHGLPAAVRNADRSKGIGLDIAALSS